MSTLTKVFVVLLVLFSIAFSTMTVAMVAQTANWKDNATKYEERARIADTTLRNLIAASAAQETTARDTIQRHSDRVADLEKQLQESTAANARLRTELAKLDAEKGSTESMNRAMLAQVELSRDAEAKLREHVNKIDRENIDYQQRNVDLNGRVNELHQQVAVLTEQRRQYEQQLHLLKQDVDRLSGAPVRNMENPTGIAMQNIKAMDPPKAGAIRGRILAIEGNLVTISVGTADGVRKDMKFIVHRDGQFVNEVQVSAVEPGQAAGRLIRADGMPQTGDQVTDAMSLAGR